MKFINIRLSTIAFAVLIGLLISGCGSTLEKEQAKLEPTDTLKVESEVLPAGAPTPHPYYNGRHARATTSQKQMFIQAQKLMTSKKWSLAQNTLEALTQENGKLSGAWLNLGVALQQQEKIAQAQAAYEQAINANGNNIAAYNMLGVMLREQGKFDEALLQYQQALDVWPYDTNTHRNLGILYDIYLGRWSLALKHYQAAQSLQETPDVTLKGWIIDLERRIAAKDRNGGSQ